MKRILKLAVTLLPLFLLGCGVGGGGVYDPELPSSPEGDPAAEIRITANGREFEAELNDNGAAKAFASRLPMTVGMSDMPHEKYVYLPQELPSSPSNPGSVRAGDLMLWGTDCFVLFYETFSTSYSYTPIGRIRDAESLASALGTGSVTVTFEMKNGD